MLVKIILTFKPDQDVTPDSQDCRGDEWSMDSRNWLPKWIVEVMACVVLCVGGGCDRCDGWCEWAVVCGGDRLMACVIMRVCSCVCRWWIDGVRSCVCRWWMCWLHSLHAQHTWFFSLHSCLTGHAVASCLDFVLWVLHPAKSSTQILAALY